MNVPNKYKAPQGTLWVCQACGKADQNRTKVGDESCFMNAVLCREINGTFVAVPGLSRYPTEEELEALNN